jgi:hypothetical protein
MSGTIPVPATIPVLLFLLTLAVIVCAFFLGAIYKFQQELPWRLASHVERRLLPYLQAIRENIEKMKAPSIAEDVAALHAAALATLDDITPTAPTQGWKPGKSSEYARAGGNQRTAGD